MSSGDSAIVSYIEIIATHLLMKSIGLYFVLIVVPKATIYNWKAKYGGMEMSELKRVKELEEENRKLKQMYADLALDNKMLKDVLGKKF